ncbi:MAG: hypothetical protein R3Y63_05135 [Eubacteriales bacterium]
MIKNQRLAPQEKSIWIDRVMYLLFGVYLCYYFWDTPHFGDDLYIFFDMKENYTLWEYTVMRYETWSSRQIIEVVLYYIVHWKPLWAILSGLIAVTCCKLLANFQDDPQPKAWLCISVFWLYPMSEMYSAGWIAATTNYLWVLLFLMTNLLLLGKVIRGHAYSKSFYILQLFAMTYATNQEQSAALHFGSFLLGTAYVFFSEHKIMKKLGLSPQKPYDIPKEMKRLLPFLLFSFVMVVYHLTCPGNEVRTELHGGIFFPRHSELALWQHLELGITFTLFWFMFQYYQIIVPLFVLVMLLGLEKNNKKALFSLGIMPCALLGLFYFLSNPSHGVTYEQLIPGILTDASNTIMIISDNPSLLIPNLLIFVSFLGFNGALCLVCQDRKKSFLVFVLIMAGFLSRVIMGFSPTVLISRNRTYMFMLFAYMLIILELYRQLVETKNKPAIAIGAGVIVLTGFCSFIFTY